MGIRLSVNVNKIALLRNTRDLNIPDVLQFVELAVQAGAGGITVHPRPDARHIRVEDVEHIALFLRKHPHVELNIEGNPFHPPMLDLARRWRPAQVTLVPDDPAARTSDHGWELREEELERLRSITGELKASGIRVSLFMDPQPERLTAVVQSGADRIELYTESFARACGTAQEAAVSKRYEEMAGQATRAGLGVNAGHDLNQKNLAKIKSWPGLQEVSIGHALTAEALLSGWEATIRAYLDILR
ncbi:MAG: pyridoxine 5'-phosphate synthase [Spirochaetales bacterium]|nr:pyridoxine 5'-phosphate synthase [Spirochaetales bacterium]